ncbi:MAG: monovalent cation/H(+) antiporter subunit G [Acidimicrobiales bacterium]
MAHAVALALVALGTAVTAAAALGALAIGGDRLNRVHFLSPVTSVGGPLVCLGLSVQYGWGLSTGITLVVGVLLAGTGPVLTSAIGRLIAQHEGRIDSEPPE